MVSKIAAWLPISEEVLGDAPSGVTEWIGRELHEATLWAAAGMRRLPRTNLSPFHRYRPRLFLPSRVR